MLLNKIIFWAKNVDWQIDLTNNGANNFLIKNIKGFSIYNKYKNKLDFSKIVGTTFEIVREHRIQNNVHFTLIFPVKAPTQYGLLHMQM